MRCLCVVNGGWDIRIVPRRPDETAGTINNNNNMVDCVIFFCGDNRNIRSNTKKGRLSSMHIAYLTPYSTYSFWQDTVPIFDISMKYDHCHSQTCKYWVEFDLSPRLRHKIGRPKM